MSVFKVVSEIGAFEAPWGKNVLVREIKYEGGLKMLQLRIQEGTRFTQLELEATTARRLANDLLSWSNANEISD
jgi:hypothetical protein